MSNAVLIHGTKESSNRADRIAIAIASSAFFNFQKSVLILPLSSKYDPQNILMGKRIKANKIIERGVSFNDEGIDALFRRGELENLSAETFSDYCFKVTKQANGFDIAAHSNKPDEEEFYLNNDYLLKSIISQAKKAYDLVILLVNGESKNLIENIAKSVDSEITIISQGNKAEHFGSKDTYYAINNYDGSSIFTYKEMKKIYGIEDNTKLYPVPYNIHFKDSCRKESAIEFLTANIAPNKQDDNFIFIEQIKNLTQAILKTELPVLKERNFEEKEVSRRIK